MAVKPLCVSVILLHVQLRLVVDGSETSRTLVRDINIVHRFNDVFLGGSYDTRLLTRDYIDSNFFGTIQKVHFSRRPAVCTPPNFWHRLFIPFTGSAVFVKSLLHFWFVICVN